MFKAICFITHIVYYCKLWQAWQLICSHLLHCLCTFYYHFCLWKHHSTFPHTDEPWPMEIFLILPPSQQITVEHCSIPADPISMQLFSRNYKASCHTPVLCPVEPQCLHHVLWCVVAPGCTVPEEEWWSVIEGGRARTGSVHREHFRSINQPDERMLQASFTSLAPVWTWQAQRLSLSPPPIHPSSLCRATSFPSSPRPAPSVGCFGVGSCLACFIVVVITS